MHYRVQTSSYGLLGCGRPEREYARSAHNFLIKLVQASMLGNRTININTVLTLLPNIIMRKTTLLKSMLLLCALIVGSGSLWADETPVYTLSFTQLSNESPNNSYTAVHSTVCSEITWNVFGNQTQGAFIRVGGKNTTATDRTLTSTSVLSSTKAIGRVVINHSGTGTGSNTTITVNSLTVEGSTSSTFDSSVKSKTISDPSVSSAGELEFTLADGNWDANSYFRIKMNYLVAKTDPSKSGPNNSYLIINNVKFYEAAPEGTTAAPTISGAEDFFTTRTVSISNAPSADGASIYYTLNGDDPTTTPSATCFAYTAPFEVSATTTVKAIAKHADDTNASSVVSKTFTKQTTINGITALNAAANGTHYVVFTNAQFTYFNGNQGFLNDANAGILYYKSGHPAVKTTYNGICRVEKTVYNQMPELTNIEAIDGECTVTTPDELQAPVVLTASELETNFSGHLARQIQVNNYTVTDAGNFATGKAFYTGWFNPALTVGCTYNLVGYPFNNNGTMQYRLVAATVPVTISASKYASFCSTSALDFTDTDVKAYKAKVDEGKVVLTQVDNVPANEGVILYGEAGDYNVPVIASASAVSENELVGVTAETSVVWNPSTGVYNYILQQGTFKKASDGKLRANRAYLQTNYNVTSPGAHDLEMVFDGDVTGIKNLTTTLSQGEGVAYNLAGQRVNASHKGLVIVNGKKYLNK